MALTIDGSDPTGDLGDLLASKADYPSGGSNGDLLTKSGTTTAWAAPSVAGLTLITTESFSAVSSLSVNGCFTSTYENYRVVMYGTSSVTGTNVTDFRLRASGSDATTNYMNLYYNVTNAASVGAAFDGSRSAGVLGFLYNNGWMVTADFLRPQLASATNVHLLAATSGSAEARHIINYVFHSTASAYDGFSLLPSSGTFSGTLRIYGYRNS